MMSKRGKVIQHDEAKTEDEGGFGVLSASKTHPRLSSAKAYMERAKEYEANGYLEHAKQDYNSAILLEPQEGSTWGGRGDVNFKLGNYDDAINDYQQVFTRS